MKKIIILLISLTLIVSCLVIGASAKLFTPPEQAEYCILFTQQNIAYPYYSLSTNFVAGFEMFYPTFLAVYNTDSFSKMDDSGYRVVNVNRTTNNIKISVYNTAADTTSTIYDGVGYDVLFYYYVDPTGLFDSYAQYVIVDENYNVYTSGEDNYSEFNSEKVTVSSAESQGKTIGYGVADEPPETEPPATDTPVVPPVTPSDPAEGGHITEVITDGIIPFVGGIGSAFVMAFTSLFIYEGNINVLGIFILTMFGIALGYGVIRWITHLFRKE